MQQAQKDILQEKELQILVEFVKVCKELELKYTLAYGTLLGAERHKGFIPWDEDIDVAMLRDDYNKFIKFGQELLPKNLFIQTWETEDEFHKSYAKVLDVSTTLIEPIHRKLDIQNGIFIDIFPIDQESSNNFTRFIDNLIIYVLQEAKYASKGLSMLKSEKKNIFYKFRRLILYPFNELIGNKELNRLETYVRSKDNNNDYNYTYCDYHRPYIIRDDKLIDISIFDDLEFIKFENKLFKAIKKRDYYLNVKYGDYMDLPPKEDRIGPHNYIVLEI